MKISGPFAARADDKQENLSSFFLFMLPPTPEDWLARYAANGDEAAFTALVRAVSPMVRGAAMRRLGDAHLAEEAAQNVFVALARKAPRLAERRGLGSWLRRAAALEASVLARSRSRREARHASFAAAACQDAAPASEPESPVTSLLNEALNRLPEADRALLLGRCLEGQSYAELGAAAGKSAEAAKKRTRRALEKTAAFLRSRGVCMSAASLAAVTGAEHSPAAAALPAAPAAGAAAAGTVPLCLNRLLLFMSTSRTAFGAAALLLLLLAAAGRQHALNASLRERISARALFQQERDTAAGAVPALTAAFGTERLSLEPPLPDPLDGITLVRLYTSSGTSGGSALHEPVPAHWHEEAQERCRRAGSAEILRLMEEVEKVACSPALRREVIESLITHSLAPLDPEQAVRTAVEKRLDGLSSLMKGLAVKDPEAAEKLFTEFSASDILLRTRAGGDDPAAALMTGIGGALGGGLTPGKKPPAELFSFAERHLESGQISTLLGSLPSWPVVIDPGPFLDLAARVTDEEDRRKSFALLGDLNWRNQPDILDANRHDFMLIRDGVLHMKTNPDPLNPGLTFVAVPDVFSDPRFPPEVIREVAGGGREAIWTALVKTDSLSAKETKDEDLAWLAERFAAGKPEALAEAPVLTNQEDQRTLDRVIASASRALAARQNHALAQTMAGNIKDPALRAQTLTAAAAP